MSGPLETPLTLAHKLELNLTTELALNLARFGERGEQKVDWAAGTALEGVYSAAMTSLWWVLRHRKGRVTVLSSDPSLTTPFWAFLQAAVAKNPAIAEAVMYPGPKKMQVGPNRGRKVTVLPPIPVVIGGIQAHPHLGVVLGAADSDPAFQSGVGALEDITTGSDRIIAVW